MRRILISLGMLGVGTAALLVACSSDDSSGTSSDAGTDVSVTDSGGGTDSGKADSGGTDSGGGACQTCSDFLENGPGANPLCTTGHPSSADLEKAWFDDCVCNQDGGAQTCFSQCSDTCTSFLAPSNDCATCFSTVCGDSLAACAADGADAGPTSDAGDAGDGGDGG